MTRATAIRTPKPAAQPGEERHQQHHTSRARHRKQLEMPEDSWNCRPAGGQHWHHVACDMWAPTCSEHMERNLAAAIRQPAATKAADLRRGRVSCREDPNFTGEQRQLDGCRRSSRLLVDRRQHVSRHLNVSVICDDNASSIVSKISSVNSNGTTPL